MEKSNKIVDGVREMVAEEIKNAAEAAWAKAWAEARQRINGDLKLVEKGLDGAESDIAKLKRDVHELNAEVCCGDEKMIIKSRLDSLDDRLRDAMAIIDELDLDMDKALGIVSRHKKDMVIVWWIVGVLINGLVAFAILFGVMK